MARIGEGDPRWLVQDRADGTNVNNWHWSDYNCTTDAKKRLSELLAQVPILENGDEFCRFVSVDKVGGEVSVSVRKGKLFVFYELDLKINWEGCRSGNLQLGTIHIPNIETDDDDFDTEILANEKNEDSSYFVSAVKSKGVPIVKNKIQELVDELKKEHQRKVLKEVPSASQTTPAPKQDTNVNTSQPTPAPAPAPTSKTETSQKTTTKIDTKSISLKSNFSASMREVYDALLDGPRTSAFTQSSCSIEPKVGGKFTMFNGNIQGEFLELDAPKKIKQKWRMSSWPQGHNSEVTIELVEKKGGVQLQLSQKGIPYEDVEKTERGWTDNYWRGMKLMHNWGNMYGE
eukprot:TRINITY_DN12610_c0_g1_i1.p1 TRINITY_DN12610_c0_g1~~TRINITY_DN12610_c0_g1_i1.p1  ORF type:complete len:345 (+),score=72.22 TRINITY_DN12610_c0_g1_i1:25-1059(+)